MDGQDQKQPAGNDMQKPNEDLAPNLTPEKPAEPVEKTTQEQKNWYYQSGNLTNENNLNEPSGATPQTGAHDSISWNASEFVHHEKSSTWYIYIALGAIVLATGIYFLTKDIFSTVIIVLVGVIFAGFGAMKPKTLDYAVGPDGIQMGNRHFMFEDFRSFAVIEEGPLPSIQLLPHKRFALTITMYCDPKQADKIIKILGEYLPFEHQDRDFMDKLASKIHF